MGNHHNFLKASNVFVFLFFAGSNLYSLLGPEVGEPYYSHGRLTYLTPAPWTFYVWSLIYMLLGGFVVYQFFERPRDSSAGSSDPQTASTHAVGSAFITACLLNSMWFSLWQSHHYILAMLVMIMVTTTISYAYYALREFPARTTTEAILIHAPFSLWHAWSVFTLCLSIFAVFTRLHDPLHPGVMRTIFAIATMAFLASSAIAYTEIGSRRKGDIVGALVIAWCLFGVYANQPAGSIHWTAFGLGLAVVFYALKPFVQSKVRGTNAEHAPLLG